jgi:hypothetical protein
MKENKRLKMKQVANNRWNLLSPNGTIMAEDILVYSEYEAIEWVKAYISTWPSWSFEVISKGGNDGRFKID